MAKQTYYSYDPSQGSAFVRMLAWLGIKRPYCSKCHKTVRIHERMIGLGVEGTVLPDHQRSAVVDALRREDWSILDQVTPVLDWSLQPAILVGLGRCDFCNGPLVMWAEIHGRGSDGKIYLGELFSTELQSDSSLVFLKHVLDKRLLSNKKAAEHAIALYESLARGSGAGQYPSLHSEAERV